MRSRILGSTVAGVYALWYVGFCLWLIHTVWGVPRWVGGPWWVWTAPIYLPVLLVVWIGLRERFARRRQARCMREWRRDNPSLTQG